MKYCMMLITFALALPGCIAWEIRDEMRVTNQHLCEVKPLLVQTLLNVEETNEKIERTSAQLSEVYGALTQTHDQLVQVHASLRRTHEHLLAVDGSLGRMDPQLSRLDDGLERLRVLDDVNSSIKHVHDALRPLSGAMGSLGGTLSFLGVGDSSGDLLAEPAPSAPVEAPAGGEPAVAHESTRRPDPLPGTWVLVYPPPQEDSNPAKVLVLAPGGTFVVAIGGGLPTAGTWSREGRFVTFATTPDLKPITGNESVGTDPAIRDGRSRC
jgi:hypothetical protein